MPHSIASPGKTVAPSRAATRPYTRLSLEQLEAREVPAVYLVTNTNLFGPGSLSQALTSANANPGADEIYITVSGVLTLSSPLDITDAVTIAPVGSANFVITGGGTTRLFNVLAPTTIRGLTLQNGFADPNDLLDPNPGLGGAIYAEADLTVSDSVLTGNAAQFGGAIYSSGGRVLIRGSVLTDNTAIQSGGAVSVSQANLTVSSAEVRGNTSLTGVGGGLCVFGGQMLVVNSLIEDNFAVSGGGLAVQTAFNTAGGGDINVVDSIVRLNGAANEGGGIFNAGGNVIITRTQVVDNAATTDGVTFTNAPGFGGGIWARGNVLVQSSLVAGNTARRGGGIYQGDSAGNITILNSTLSGNGAVDAGGGIYVGAGGLSVYNSTIVLNKTTATGSTGGGIGADGPTDILLVSTIVAGNTSGGSPHDIAPNANASNLNSQFNLIGNAATAGGLSHGTAGNLVGLNGSGTRPIATIIDTNLTDTTGPTPSHRLAFGSPAVDAGSNPLGLPEDQRGRPRQAGLGVDIGATEGTTLWTTALAYGSTVNLFDADGLLVASVPTGLPQVRVATGDVTGDGIPDLIIASGKGNTVRVHSGIDAQLLSQFFPYGKGHKGGINVAVADVNGNGTPDIIVAPASGAAGKLPVQVRNYATNTVLAKFRPFYQHPNTAVKNYSGVRLSAGNLDADANAEIVVSTVAPAPAVVQVFNYQPGTTQFAGKVVATNAKLTHQFAPGFAGKGAYTAVDSDANRIVVGSGGGTAPARFQVFTPVAGAPGKLGSAVAASPVVVAFSDPGSQQEVRVAVRDIDDDGTAELLVATGPGALQELRIYDLANLSIPLTTLGPADLFVPVTYTAGLFV